MLKKQNELQNEQSNITESLSKAQTAEAALQKAIKNLSAQNEELAGQLQRVTGGKEPKILTEETKNVLQKLEETVANAKKREAEQRANIDKLKQEIAALTATFKANREELAGVERRLTSGLTEAGFSGMKQAEDVTCRRATGNSQKT